MIHFAHEELRGIHYALCGKQFKEMDDRLTTAVSVVTCKSCKDLIRKGMHKGIHRLSMPVDVRIRHSTLTKEYGKIRRTENAPVVIEVYIGKFQVFLNMNESEMLLEKITNSVHDAKVLMETREAVYEIESYIDGLRSVINSFKEEPQNYEHGGLEHDLRSDLNDLKEAIDRLPC
jgi:hypothetical protein